MAVATKVRPHASATADFHVEAKTRRSTALRLALTALRSLEAMGARGWVIGSLAKGRFSPHSDIDFVVDCPRAREHDAFRAIETALGDFPFHMIPRSRIVDESRAHMMEGALDASGLVARQAEAR